MKNLFSMHRVIVSVAEMIHVDFMMKFVVMYRRWWINRRGRTWFVNVGVRVLFSRVIAAKRRNIIIRSRLGRRRTIRFMMTYAAITAMFIGVMASRSRGMVVTVRGGVIWHVDFYGVITWRGCFRIIKVIGILVEKGVRWFGKSTSHTVIKYFEKT